MKRKRYHLRCDSSKQAVEVIRWLRAHGVRGSDFDFAGSIRLDIEFYNDKLELAYIMRWDWRTDSEHTNGNKNN